MEYYTPLQHGNGNSSDAEAYTCFNQFTYLDWKSETSDIESITPTIGCSEETMDMIMKSDILNLSDLTEVPSFPGSLVSCFEYTSPSEFENNKEFTNESSSLKSDVTPSFDTSANSFNCSDLKINQNGNRKSASESKALDIPVGNTSQALNSTHKGRTEFGHHRYYLRPRRLPQYVNRHCIAVNKFRTNKYKIVSRKDIGKQISPKYSNIQKCDTEGDVNCDEYCQTFKKKIVPVLVCKTGTRTIVNLTHGSLKAPKYEVVPKTEKSEDKTETVKTKKMKWSGASKNIKRLNNDLKKQFEISTKQLKLRTVKVKKEQSVNNSQNANCKIETELHITKGTSLRKESQSVKNKNKIQTRTKDKARLKCNGNKMKIKWSFSPNSNNLYKEYKTLSPRKISSEHLKASERNVCNNYSKKHLRDDTVNTKKHLRDDTVDTKKHLRDDTVNTKKQHRDNTVKRKRRSISLPFECDITAKVEQGMYCCTSCNYKSRDPGQVTLHIRRHLGFKPYTCFFCSYSTGDKSHLRRHIKIHTGERPHHCPYCDKSWIQKVSLTKHICSNIIEERL